VSQGIKARAKVRAKATTTIINNQLSSCSGMITLVFAAVVLPLVFIMLTVTVEFAHFFGIREELQSVLDREAHDALVRGLAESQVQESVRSRMANIGGIAALSGVQFYRGASSGVLEAQAEYRGAFFQLIQDLTGSKRSVLPIALRSQVRIQPAATLILVDRAIPGGSDPCNEQGFKALASFADRLSLAWSERAKAHVSVGVIPGAKNLTSTVTAPVELLTTDSSDAVPRCGRPNWDNGFDLSSVRGSFAMSADPLSAAYSIQDLASSELSQMDSEVRSLVILLRRERYDQGYGVTIINLLKDSSRDLPFTIDTYFLVLDNTQTIDSNPTSAGINGGVYREVGASESEFLGSRLVEVMTRSLTDRIVLER